METGWAVTRMHRHDHRVPVNAIRRPFGDHAAARAETVPVFSGRWWEPSARMMMMRDLVPANLVQAI